MQTQIKGIKSDHHKQENAVSSSECKHAISWLLLKALAGGSLGRDSKTQPWTPPSYTLQTLPPLKRPTGGRPKPAVVSHKQHARHATHFPQNLVLPSISSRNYDWWRHPDWISGSQTMKHPRTLWWCVKCAAAVANSLTVSENVKLSTQASHP